MFTMFGEDTEVEILEVAKPITDHIAKKIHAYGEDVDPFFIGDLGDIIQKHKSWKQYFPRIEPFYAVKCNDLKPVIKLMADIGLSFDCASQIEIEKVLEHGVDPSRIIFANSCKQASFIRYAANKGVSMMTFDNEEELIKFKNVYPNARLVLRICPPKNPGVKYYLGKKFGCQSSKSRHLLEVAKKLGLNVIGVSFHVRSECVAVGAFEDAIRLARGVFDKGIDLGFKMHLLDIGGGMPGHDMPNFSFEKMADGINRSLDKYFPDVRIVAEPGRYFVASAFTVATNIIGKRIVEGDELDEITGVTSSEPVFMYYVNDGIYGSFFAEFLDPGCFVPLCVEESDPNLLHKSIIWGPTCDSLDLIIQDYKLPELRVGEWIYFKNMGAYTFPNACHFNNMQPIKHNFMCEKKLWEEFYNLNNKVDN